MLKQRIAIRQAQTIMDKLEIIHIHLADGRLLPWRAEDSLLYHIRSLLQTLVLIDVVFA